MSNFLNGLKNETSKTTTTNGAVAYKTTYNTLLDIFGSVSSFRNKSAVEVEKIFATAFSEDALLATKLMFWIRDVRQGAGERKTFRIMLKWIAEKHPNILLKNIKLVAEYGRWDDLLPILDTDVATDVISLFREQLKADWESTAPSLLSKWMPSANASSKETKRLAKIIIKGLGTNEKTYRQTLSKLRAKLNLVETALSSQNYSSIQYDKIPSKAGMKYRTAFFTHDEERYKKFLDSLEKGEVKVNAKTLYPKEIVDKFLFEHPAKEEETLLNAMWKNLEDYIQDSTKSILPVVDVSGSMFNSEKSIAAAVGLGIYLSEKCKSEYQNHFITFSEAPQLAILKGKTLSERISNIIKEDWAMSTNLEAVFNLVLDTAIKNKLPQEDLPTSIAIFSDMEINSCSRHKKDIVQLMTKKFAKHGYKLPQLIFWNLNVNRTIFPCTTQDGILLVSGYSPSLFKTILKGDIPNPESMMLEVLNADRYNAVTI